MKITVNNMSGAGNTFSVIDNRKYQFNHEQLKKLSVILCNENKVDSKKMEGMIAIDKHKTFDFEALFFNPDGSYGAMCGNGGRCAVYIADKLGLINKTQNERTIFMMASGIYEAKFKNDTITLFFPPPVKVIIDQKNKLDKSEINFGYADVGSDHVVIRFEDLAIADEFREFDIRQIACPIRYSEHFAPKGTNVNIYKIQDDEIHLRTYERGVEGETGACGTGAISTALISFLRGEIESPVKVIPPSGQTLIVDFQFGLNRGIERIMLTGNAEITSIQDIELPTNFI